MDGTVRIGVVGDFDRGFRSHVATDAALGHAAESLAIRLEADWVPTSSVSGTSAAEILGGYHGLWISAGSPYRSMAGALAAIEFARTRGWPMFAT